MTRPLNKKGRHASRSGTGTGVGVPRAAFPPGWAYSGRPRPKRSPQGRNGPVKIIKPANVERENNV